MKLGVKWILSEVSEEEEEGQQREKEVGCESPFFFFFFKPLEQLPKYYTDKLYQMQLGVVEETD